MSCALRSAAPWDSHSRAISVPVTLTEARQGLGGNALRIYCFSYFQVTPNINNTGLFILLLGCRPESQPFWLDSLSPRLRDSGACDSAPLGAHSHSWCEKWSPGESEVCEGLKSGAAQSRLYMETRKTGGSTQNLLLNSVIPWEILLFFIIIFM